MRGSHSIGNKWNKSASTMQIINWILFSIEANGLSASNLSSGIRIARENAGTEKLNCIAVWLCASGFAHFSSQCSIKKAQNMRINTKKTLHTSHTSRDCCVASQLNRVMVCNRPAVILSFFNLFFSSHHHHCCGVWMSAKRLPICSIGARKIVHMRKQTLFDSALQSRSLQARK